jgi:glutathione S-transferase
MTVTITAMQSAPDFAQGYVKDIGVRWALEEAGLAYETQLVDLSAAVANGYCRWQPFAQVPAYRDDEVEIFESGAIVLRVAEMSDVLLPQAPAGRARAITWIFAALTSVEPHAHNLIHLRSSDTENPWAEAHRLDLEAKLYSRLESLATWIGQRAYLEDRFTAGDLIMTMVLRELIPSGILSPFPTLVAYCERCEARPAFSRAMNAHLKPYR